MEFETYADVIDAYESDNMGYETLTDYINKQNIKIKEIDMDPLGDLERIINSKAYGGGVGHLMEPSQTYHQYHDFTAPMTVGAMVDNMYKSGGRVALQNGSNWWDNLSAPGMNVYNAMKDAGHDDSTIQGQLSLLGYYDANAGTPDPTPDPTPTPGQGGNQGGGGGDSPYAGQVVDQTDYSFNKKNYAPGGKLEINPAALGIGFYESGPGKVKDQLPQSFVEANKHLSPNQQKNKYYTGKEVGVDYGALEAKEPGFIESFMSAAVPNKMKSTVTMPGHKQFGPVNPSEFRNFIDADIEGISGNLNRQDLANMYEDYSKFFGRKSNYAGARVPGTAGNLVNMIPYMGPIKKGAEAIFGPQGDKSLQGKYTVDNAGFGNTGARDEFGLATFNKKDGFLGLSGNTTRDYVDRMQEKVKDLTKFFGDRIEDFDINNLTPDMLTDMRRINGFYTKQIQAYQDRLNVENLNRQQKDKEQAQEIAKQKQEAAFQAQLNQAQKKQRMADLQRVERAYREDTGGRAGSYGPGGTSGQQSDGSYNDPFDPGGGEKDGGLIGYQKGGLATMFTRRR